MATTLPEPRPSWSKPCASSNTPSMNSRPNKFSWGLLHLEGEIAVKMAVMSLMCLQSMEVSRMEERRESGGDKHMPCT